jgi:hypothetical protein
MMNDFTFHAYAGYMKAIMSKYTVITRIDEYLSMEKKPESFCLIRHDIDRKPHNALLMADLEQKLGVTATYYFRTKPHTFQPEIMRRIQALGHEIGYHYESLSDARGDTESAMRDFETNLARFRRHVTVKTIAMHGRPLSGFDDRDLWRSAEHHSMLRTKFGILGEAYLDVDYSDIAYITDTGRNWSRNKFNRLDKVISSVNDEFANGKELLQYLLSCPHRKLVFQVHPERWTDHVFEWTLQCAKDAAMNAAKAVLSLRKR